MSTAGLIGLIIVIIIILVIVIWYITTYNRLIRLRNEVERSWGNIDVLLKQRYDMIPNLVNTVKGYAKHETGIFDKITEARKQCMGAREGGDIAALSQAEGVLGGALGRLFALAEDNPELKADKSFVNLQKEISGIENQIADRREHYNSSVTIWNTAIQQIPANIVANTMGAQRKDVFKVEEAAVRETPKVEF